MLIGNGIRAGGNPMRFYGGAQQHSIAKAYFYQKGARNNFHAGEATVVSGSSTSNKNGFPSGYRHPYSYLMAIKNGGIGSRNIIEGTTELDGLIAGGKNAEADLTGDGQISLATLTATIAASSNITSVASISAEIYALAIAQSALTGSGTITLANMSASLSAIAALVGSTTISATGQTVISATAALVGSTSLTAEMAGAINATAALVGSGTITQADLILALFTSAALTGSTSISATALAKAIATAALAGSTSTTFSATAKGTLAADITPFTDLSPETLSAAVWNAILSNYQGAGTTGKALSDAGSAGNPWSALLASNNDPNTFGQLMQIIENLVDELHKMQGLDISNPMTVTPTTREAGSISLEITGDGETTSTVTRQ